MLPPIEFTLGERVKLNATGVEFTPMVNATLFIRGGIYFEISGNNDKLTLMGLFSFKLSTSIV